MTQFYDFILLYLDVVSFYKSKILLKIVVEGNEINVFEGAKKILINRNISYVQVENAKNKIYESKL